MPALAMAKCDTGRRLHSHAVLADGNQTKLCAYLSTIVLGGLVLNATMGWWWADPLAGLAIAALAVNGTRSVATGRLRLTPKRSGSRHSAHEAGA